MTNNSYRWRFAVSAFCIVAFLMILLFSGSPRQKAQETDRIDAVTQDIRDGSKKLVRVVTKDDSEKTIAAKYGRIVADYGPFVIIAAGRTLDLTGTGLEYQIIDASVSLPGGRFDPLNDPPAGTVTPGRSDAAGGAGYYIVQFGGIATDEWLDRLRAAGVEILQYVPNQAFFVYADADAIAKAAAHPRVRWVGALLPGYKLTPVLIDQLSAARLNSSPGYGVSPLELIGPNSGIFDVAIFKRADVGEIARRISSSYGGGVKQTLELPNNYFNVVRIELPLDRVTEIADIPDVITIDSWARPVAEDERAAQIVAGNYTNQTTINAPGYNPLSQFGVDGTNVTVSMVDDGVSIPGNGGFYITPANTVNAPLRGAAAGATGGHGHLNASIIAGSTPFGASDPTGYNYGLGVAPKSNIINIPLLTGGYTGSESDTYNDTVTTPGPNGVNGLISNNSWGNGTNSNVYDSYTAQFDGFVRDASAGATIDPVSLIFSAGNSGPGALSLTRPKAAKNLIAVGNSENLRTEILGASADNLDDLRSSSSRGPTSDGRVKPDVTAPGTAIAGSRAGNGSSVSGQIDANHSYSTGTSHAAPQVAGAAALFTQFWKSGHNGQNPSPALIKASVINTAQEMNGANVTGPIPNGAEGWGRMNLKLMFAGALPVKRIDQTSAFSNPGESVVYAGTVADAAKPVRLSLVWTDPPGVSSPALVNNLDLTVTIGGTEYKGNVFTGGVSTTGGSANTVDNVENVFLAAGLPAGTTISVRVAATALNGDGILGNVDTTDQHFALVAYNFSEQQAVRAPFDFDGDGKTDLSIFRPGPGEWWYQKSGSGGNAAVQFGTSTDKLTPGDFTGDGKSDVAFWRPSTGEWFVLRSEDFSFFSFPFGIAGDVPAPADYDGDGKTDAAVFRPSLVTWFVINSGGGTTIRQFGAAGDVPVPADYDGDGKSDIAIFRPNAVGGAEWWVQRSTASLTAIQFGQSTDRTVPGDYTGDRKTDVAVWRPSTGSWFILRSEDNSFFSFAFGAAGDLPAPGDYDGDGKIDAAVFRPSDSNWFANRSTAGVLIQQFGQMGDLPVPNAFIR